MLGFDLTDEQLELKALAHKFAEQEIIPRAREYDEKEIFPRRRVREGVHGGADEFRRAEGNGWAGTGRARHEPDQSRS